MLPSPTDALRVLWAQLEEEVQQQQVAILEKNIDAVWRLRIENGDPFQKLLHQDKVRAQWSWRCLLDKCTSTGLH